MFPSYPRKNDIFCRITLVVAYGLTGSSSSKFFQMNWAIFGGGTHPSARIRYCYAPSKMEGPIVIELIYWNTTHLAAGCAAAT